MTTRILLAAALLSACVAPSRRGDDEESDGPLPGVGVVGSSGGTVQSEEGVRVTIPEGALAAGVEISITPAAHVPAGGYNAVEIEPSGTVFERPVTLAFRYPESVASSTPKVMTVVDGVWRALPGRTLNATARIVTGLTTHLSPYAVVAASENCANHVDDDGDDLADCQDPACEHAIACAPTCIGDYECESDERCVNGLCRHDASSGGGGDAHPPCHADADCPSGQRCLATYLCGTPPAETDAGHADGGHDDAGYDGGGYDGGGYDGGGYDGGGYDGGGYDGGDDDGGYDGGYDGGDDDGGYGYDGGSADGGHADGGHP